MLITIEYTILLVFESVDEQWWWRRTCVCPSIWYWDHDEEAHGK